MSSQADRARSLFCFYRLLLVAAAAALLLCDEAAAQGTSCGKLVPGQVDPVTVAAVRSSTNSSIIVDWLAPDSGITGYFYTLSCPSCPTQQLNASDETFTFRDLPAATEYNFSIQAGLRNCRLSPAFHLSGRTDLNKVPGSVHISDVTETSFRARWAASPDVGVEYEVSCAGRVPDTTAVCTGQPSGASVTVTVRPVKTGFPPAPFIHGTALTKLFPIDASSVSFTITETSITLTWAASITEGVLYRVTCRRVSTGTSTSLPPSQYLSASISSLQSGEAYNLSVAVTKQGGFDEVVTWLPIQLTKLFGIDASSAQYSSNETAISVTWQPSSTSGVSYQLTCKRVGSGEVSTASSPTPSATCGSLQSGQEYELRVAVQKEGGFDDVITALSNQLTTLLASRTSSPASESAQVKSRTASSSTPSATCGSLQSGQEYELRVAVQKARGFDDVITALSNQLTKLFPIDASLVSFTITETSISLTWVASITEGVLYRMTCRRVSTGNSTSLPPSKYLSATFSNLQSGEAYNLSVAVTKQGGFDEVVTWLPIQLTKLFSIDASSAQYSSNETAI
uniref:Protein-tyrosine-phosphatase n=1 Tax=Macrostomum lignano TaxID=282301 RepID=A0A1I8HN17_9PLAT